MAKDRELVVDPRFSVPFGVIDIRQKSAERGDYYYNTDSIAEEGPILDVPESRIPMPPSNYEIVDQVVRTASDGRAVVDVYIEFPDIEGVNMIDVRVTKI